MTTLPGTVQERIALPPAVESAGGEGGALTGADILAMLRRRMLLIITLSILFSIMAGGGFIAWWTYWPGYRAECLIECVSNLPESGLTMEAQTLRQDEHERFVLTQALLVKSPEILEEALKVTAVRDTAWFRRAQAKENPLLTLTDHLQAAPARGTNFLRIAIECREAKDPHEIVNAVVKEWYATVKRRSANEFAAELGAAQTEEANLATKVAEKRRQLAAIAERLPPGARLAPGNNITSQEVRQFGEQVSLLTLEQSQLAQYRHAYNSPDGVAVTAESRAMVEQDPQVAELARTVFLLDQQLAVDAQNFGPNHRVLQKIEAQIAAAEERLAELRTQRLDEINAEMREAVDASYFNTQHALLLAQNNLLEAEARLQDQDRLLFDYINLEAEIVADELYRTELSNHVRTLGRIVRQQTAIKINEPLYAQAPLRRSSPNKLLIAVGLFLSLGLATCIGLGLELIDKTLRTPQDIVRHLNLALLGVIPHTDDEEVKIDTVETAAKDAPRSMVAEAFRRIRASLQFAAPAAEQRCVLVTGPRPEDGKTTVACNLAIALAQAGRRVLLIDANFHRPRLATIFASDRKAGLSNLLIGEGSLGETVFATDVPKLDVLGTGPIPPNPAELLGGETSRSLLKEAGAQYDQVIIDAPPVLLTTDPLALAPIVDGIVLVVRAKEDSRGVGRRACSLLTGVGGHLFGAVLNAAQVTRGGYFREQLRTYYDYQIEAPSD